jgi:tripartite-type tricarboxylate transporter receptor subunit TctC
MNRFATLLSATWATVVCLCGGVQAADFYAGKTITITTGGSPGGSYDTHTRTVAAYMGKHIPGNPSFVIQNNQAGHGIAAANHIFNAARKDGTEIGQFNRDALILALLGTDLTKFKLTEFNWLGSPASYNDNAHVLLIRGALPYKTAAEIRAANATISIGNKGDNHIPVAKDTILKSIKIIKGYTGDVINMALERGEIDGLSTGWSNVIRETPLWIKDNLARPIVQFGHEKRITALPDVPTAQELAQTPDDLALIKFDELSLVLGFPFAAPPGVPADRLAILRKAFDDTMNDPEYAAAIQKIGLEYTPQTWETLGASITEATKASPAVLDRYKKINGENGGAS